ncbi:hypothetical protein F5Y16DRAFT_406113 [Xylariaceae sp. FL0255]|nr:hypothetical protein F5Y16DRAFT_406113 [Xylariaceae sp. FL0255]
MDDPINWDVDRVIRELCSPDHPVWTPLPKPELPTPEQLAACLCKQGVDSCAFLTYPNESELYDSLGITTLKHKHTFFHVRRELRRQSKQYQQYLAQENTSIPPSPPSIEPAGDTATSLPALAPTLTVPVIVFEETASHEKRCDVPTLPSSRITTPAHPSKRPSRGQE